VKVLIGGAPVTSQYAKEIGADGYSESANGAVSLVKSLIAMA
jgi:5-methyltetrahydrofolate--homocysteine methyltransferase